MVSLALLAYDGALCFIHFFFAYICVDNNRLMLSIGKGGRNTGALV